MTIHGAAARRFGALLLALTMTTAAAVLFSSPGNALIVPTVGLGTAANYSVLGGQTVTNSGPSTLNKSLGLSPGSSVTGFPPGIVAGSTDVTNGAAATAQLNLTTAYNDAAGRPVDVTTAADLSGLTLVGGVYGASANGPLELTGTLVLDGENNPDSVFIFQTGSSLDFAGSSSVSFIRGASACNVFWQVGSSATLVSGAAFAGNILALTSISVGTGATIRGRLLARNGSVTLLTNTFSTPTCAGETTPTPVTTPTTAPAAGPGSGGPGTTPTAGTPGGGTGTGIDTGLGEGPGTPVSGPPRTGGGPLESGGGLPWLPILFVGFALAAGTTDVLLTRRHRAHELARVGAATHPKSS